MDFIMLQTPDTFNPQVPFTNPSAAFSTPGYPNAGQSNMPPSAPSPDMAMNQIMGNPQTESYARGGSTKKRPSMIEAYMSPDEIAKMVDAQGGPDYDRHTGRHVFKKLSRFMENPHIERAIRAKFAAGGMVNQNASPMGGITGVIDEARSIGMPRPGFAGGGSTGYSMPQRSPASAENYARGGDTELVYITPHMKKLFDSLGAGSLNPVTGKPEYFGLSDIWGGIKSLGSSALGGLNAIAPQLAQAGRGLVSKLPPQYQEFANKALDYAPGAISALNNYVNPSAAPQGGAQGQSAQDQQQNQAGFSEMPFNGAESPQQPQAPSWKQQAGQFASNFAGQFNNPVARTAQAGINSYMGGRDMRQTGANMFGAATGGMRNPAMDVARSGAQQFGQGASGMDTLKHMGGQAFNRFMGQPRGNNNNDRRQMESQYLDQIYKQPQQSQNSYA
jgi:hypothetical protein